MPAAVIQLVFINGRFAPQDSNVENLPAGILLTNQAHGVVVHVSNQFAANVPIKLLHIIRDKSLLIDNVHNQIVLESNSKLILIEEQVTHTDEVHQLNTLMTVTVNKGAVLTYCKKQGLRHTEATSNVVISQKRDSTVEIIHLLSDGRRSCENINIKLEESGANCLCTGLYDIQQADQYCELNVEIEHSASHTNSDMLYKGILNSNARAAFKGRVHVKQHVEKINANQANHHLLLSPLAEASSKPELEIYADDVKCKHGATTGQLDEEALFYMRARGIDRGEAVSMLLSGFADGVMQRIAPDVKQYIN